MPRPPPSLAIAGTARRLQRGVAAGTADPHCHRLSADTLRGQSTRHRRPLASARMSPLSIQRWVSPLQRAPLRMDGGRRVSTGAWLLWLLLCPTVCGVYTVRGIAVPSLTLRSGCGISSGFDHEWRAQASGWHSTAPLQVANTRLCRSRHRAGCAPSSPASAPAQLHARGPRSGHPRTGAVCAMWGLLDSDIRRWGPPHPHGGAARKGARWEQARVKGMGRGGLSASPAARRAGG